MGERTLRSRLTQRKEGQVDLLEKTPAAPNAPGILPDAEEIANAIFGAPRRKRNVIVTLTRPESALPNSKSAVRISSPEHNQTLSVIPMRVHNPHRAVIFSAPQCDPAPSRKIFKRQTAEIESKSA